MAPFLDVNVQDSRLRHRRRVVFAARDVLLLTVELCKVELCPMLVPFVGRRLFFYRVAILHCPFFSGGVLGVWSSLQIVGGEGCVAVLSWK